MIYTIEYLGGYFVRFQFFQYNIFPSSILQIFVKQTLSSVQGHIGGQRTYRQTDR